MTCVNRFCPAGAQAIIFNELFFVFSSFQDFYPFLRLCRGRCAARAPFDFFSSLL